MTYQGHLPDGHAVQRHSAGDYFPYVVIVSDGDAGRRYGVIGPGLRSTHWAGRTASSAYALAMALKHGARGAGLVASHRLLSALKSCRACSKPDDEPVDHDTNPMAWAAWQGYRAANGWHGAGATMTLMRLGREAQGLWEEMYEITLAQNTARHLKTNRQLALT